MSGGNLNRSAARGLGAALLAATLLFALPASAQQYSDGYRFLKAVEDKDGTAALELLDRPGSTVINSRDITNGRTGLHIAVQRRDLTWIQLLAGRNANPNIRDKNGTSPLMLASQLGFVEGVQALIAAGARVDEVNDAGETPLISAVHRRQAEMIRVLVSAGANPDRTDNSGRSARDYAQQAGAGNSVLAALERSEEEGGNRASSETYGPRF